MTSTAGTGTLQTRGGNSRLIEDASEFKRLLGSKAKDLFVTNASEVSLEYIPHSGSPTSMGLVLRSEADLLNVISTFATNRCDQVFIVTQKGSWSRLRVSPKMFQLLYHQLEIHPAFMEIVTSFGFKIVDEDEYSTPSFSTFNTDRALTYEIYYSVQYIELHGRNKPNDPWSFRKYAVHQKYDLDFESSSWLFVQPQEVSREWLRGGNCRQSASGPLHPLSIHLKILKSATVSWRWYLNYLSDELNRIRIRVVCRPDPKDSMLSDDIGFAHSQTLEVIQSKARRANLALKATASVLRCVESCIEEICRRQAKINCEFDASDLCATLKSELTQMGNHLEIHMRKARDIVENVSSVNMLIQRILDLHNYNTLHTNSSKLQLISSSQALETGTMLQLAVTQQKDARVMKVASIIALVYLPASLVASLFSTELFALNSVVLDMRQGIGIFLTLLLTLTASTVLTAYLWLRRDSSIARTNHALPP